MRYGVPLEFCGVLVLAHHITMRLRSSHSLAALIAALFLALTPTASSAVEVTRTDADANANATVSALGEIKYAAATDGCTIVWTLRRFTHSPGFGLAEQSQCNQPVADQAAHRSALIAKVEADYPRLVGLRNFYWGRLARADATAELAMRLQRAAAQSPQWNAAKGRPSKASDGASRVVQTLLNKHHVFAEIAAIFAAQGYQLEVNSVEKVIVGPSRDALKPGQQLPIDALVTLSVKTTATKR
jgi:hypothetical protein